MSKNINMSLGNYFADNRGQWRLNSSFDSDYQDP